MEFLFILADGLTPLTSASLDLKVGGRVLGLRVPRPGGPKGTEEYRAAAGGWN